MTVCVSFTAVVRTVCVALRVSLWSFIQRMCWSLRLGEVCVLRHLVDDVVHRSVSVNLLVIGADTVVQSRCFVGLESLVATVGLLWSCMMSSVHLCPKTEQASAVPGRDRRQDAGLCGEGLRVGDQRRERPRRVLHVRRRRGLSHPPERDGSPSAHGR